MVIQHIIEALKSCYFYAAPQKLNCPNTLNFNCSGLKYTLGSLPILLTAWIKSQLRELWSRH